MPFKIIRNDITKMNTEAIVNTANAHATVGAGCDYAVYKAAGYEELLKYRTEKIGFVPEGEAFLTPGFNLPAKYIIHAVSPVYTGGLFGEEKKLRSCYRNSLQIAKENGIKSVAFPLISTGSFGYPKEEGMRIAADEIHAFLLENEMMIYLVVFDSKATELGERIYSDLETYIDHHYVSEKCDEEYGNAHPFANTFFMIETAPRAAKAVQRAAQTAFAEPTFDRKEENHQKEGHFPEAAPAYMCEEPAPYLDFEEQHESRLEERIKHISDTFSEYLMYLIRDKKMVNADVYKRAIVDKKIFSKIKNNADYHPQKLTALCLCIGAKLNLDESKELLARAGYALSPCDKTDIIFSYFIENEIYDMIELDIQLEEHGLPCIIS